jgi:Tfp pilus assembly protein FimV
MTHTPSFSILALQHGLCLAICSLALHVFAADAVPAAPHAATYTTKAGDSIERLLHNAMPSSPLNPALLRKALADQNPQTVNGKPGQKFKTGTVIHLPDHGQLVRNSLEPFASQSQDSTTRNGYSAGDPSSRRNWIRYP